MPFEGAKLLLRHLEMEGIMALTQLFRSVKAVAMSQFPEHFIEKKN